MQESVASFQNLQRLRTFLVELVLLCVARFYTMLGLSELC